jgi:sarcosine oxidase delta subunit
MVQEQWKNASGMRLWLTEKVKNLTSKIAKQKKHEYIESIKKKDKTTPEVVKTE